MAEAGRGARCNGQVAFITGGRRESATLMRASLRPRVRASRLST